VLVATVERNDTLLTGRNLWQNQTQEGWPSASTSWGLRREKKGGKNTITPFKGYLLEPGNTS